MDWKKTVFAASCIALAAITILWSDSRLRRLQRERDRYKANTETLLEDVERYRVFDSLSAARVQSLELTVKEFERFRAQDAETIKALKARNRDLAEVSKTQAETIIELSAVPRDTVIIRDSVPVKAVAVTCGDAWYDFYGLLTPEEFTGELRNRDSLLIAESVRYKRFLGFLWKTKKEQDRRLDVMSKNPYTTILNVEHIVIKK